MNHNEFVTIMDFSHIYEMEKFYRNKKVRYIDCTQIKGTDCFCDSEAADRIRKAIESYSCEGIHFIDSGNYHYVTKFWIEKIKRDFVLVVFDHHSDMQKPLFGDILTCGDWIMNAIDTIPFLHKVVLIGINEKQAECIPDQYKSKLEIITEAALSKEATWKQLTNLPERIDTYISVDKDILSPYIVETDWDQGNVPLGELKRILGLLLDKEHIVGIDICGECSTELDAVTDIANNDTVNRKLMEFISYEKYL